MTPTVMHEIESHGRERTLLVGLVVPGLPRSVVEEHLDELERLVDTAGGDVVGREIQERAKPAAATLVGGASCSGSPIDAPMNPSCP